MAEIKICGITNQKDGKEAVELGADYIGFVFYDKSPRNITPRMAKKIGRSLIGVKKVGLFVNEDPKKVNNIADLVGLDVIQFHGDESPEYCRQFNGREVWKAIRVKDEGSISEIARFKTVDAVVLDKYVDGKMGGTGESFDWDLAEKAKGLDKQIVLAGGLNPANVADAILKVNPLVVDVSSGVEEAKGKKSYEKMKKFIDTARTPSVLLKIVGSKRNEVDLLYNTGKAEAYSKNAMPRDKRMKSFYDAVSKRHNRYVPNLIAEFKQASPSKGDIRSGATPEQIAKIYSKYGASAISVLTDQPFFKGDIEYIPRIKKVTNLPVLRKDFIIDEAQIYEARCHGADAILLIAAILETTQMKDYMALAESLGMDCLVESHNKYELDKSMEAGAKILGINNRNLHNSKVDLKTTADLLYYIPEDRVVVTESGIHTYEDVSRMAPLRVKSMLVGESLMKERNIPAKMKELLGK